MTTNKFNNIKFKFPKDPLNTEFMKIWHETIERDDFKELKKKVLIAEIKSEFIELNKSLNKRHVQDISILHTIEEQISSSHNFIYKNIKINSKINMSDIFKQSLATISLKTNNSKEQWTDLTHLDLHKKGHHTFA